MRIGMCFSFPRIPKCQSRSSRHNASWSKTEVRTIFVSYPDYTLIFGRQDPLIYTALLSSILRRIASLKETWVCYLCSQLSSQVHRQILHFGCLFIAGKGLGLVGWWRVCCNPMMLYFWKFGFSSMDFLSRELHARLRTVIEWKLTKWVDLHSGSVFGQRTNWPHVIGK